MSGLTVFIVLFVAVPAIGIALAAQNRVARRQRGEAVTAWAADRGWAVSPADPTVAGLRCPPVEHDGDERHVVHGTDPAGRPVVAFEWSYTVQRAGEDARSEKVISTVVASTVPGVHPLVQVAPGHPRQGFLGLGALDPRTVATGVAGFDARRTMITEQPVHAARTVTPRVLEWLAVDPRADAIGFRLAGSWLVTWQRGGIDAVRIETALGFLDDVRDETSPEVDAADPGREFRVVPEAQGLPRVAR